MKKKKRKKYKTISEIQNIIQQCDIELTNRYFVDSVSIFGSVARQQQTRRSDIDLLVNFRILPSLFELASLEIYLTEKLGTRVDLAIENGISHQFKNMIGKDLIRVTDRDLK